MLGTFTRLNYQNSCPLISCQSTNRLSTGSIHLPENISLRVSLFRVIIPHKTGRRDAFIINWRRSNTEQCCCSALRRPGGERDWGEKQPCALKTTQKTCGHSSLSSHSPGHIPSRPVSKASKHKGGDRETGQR